MTPPLWQKVRGTTKPLDESEEESEKVGLMLNIQKTKIMVSGPITSWQADEETVETVSDFTFLASKITIDGNYSHEIKRRSFYCCFLSFYRIYFSILFIANPLVVISFLWSVFLWRLLTISPVFMKDILSR